MRTHQGSFLSLFLLISLGLLAPLAQAQAEEQDDGQTKSQTKSQTKRQTKSQTKRQVSVRAQQGPAATAPATGAPPASSSNTGPAAPTAVITDTEPAPPETGKEETGKEETGKEETAELPAASGDPVPAEPPDAATLGPLAEQTLQLRAFLGGTLELAVEPRSLFDIDLDDSQAVLVEAQRLTAIVEPLPAPGGEPTAAAPPADAGVHDSQDSQNSAHDSPDPALWQARIALDAARLDYYRRQPAERQALLNAHYERQQAASEASLAMSEANREAEETARATEAALNAAKRARSEAERAIHQEHARLLGVTSAQVGYEKRLLALAAEVASRHDAALGVQRRLVEELTLRRDGRGGRGTMDSEYVQLRARLKGARNALSDAIDLLAGAASQVPTAGPDPLSDLPTELDRSRIDRERAEIADRYSTLQQDENALYEKQARVLMAEVEMLNRLRLRLLPYLSSDKRSQVVGWGSAGFEQGRSEVRQVWLTLRYHFHATRRWLLSLRGGGGKQESAWTATWIVAEWVAVFGFFLWWRRRSNSLLLSWIADARSTHKRQLGSAAEPWWPNRALSLLHRVHRPLEMLVLLWMLIASLPAGVRALLEVQLVATIFSWTLGGTLVVNTIDALSIDSASAAHGDTNRSAALRLRSLRLIGRTVVTFGLILTLSDQLVGQGTIYDWVFSTCWFAAVPILLTIIAWWKPVIFDRIERIRKKGPLQRWVLAEQRGPRSFVAAIVGGVYLFGSGAMRVARSWVVTFTLVRRVLAYMFRRDMGKQAAEEQVSYRPLDAATFARLGPESPSEEMVPSVADAQVSAIIERIEREGGGVYAIVGERGAGKSTVLERISASSPGVTYVQCPTGGLSAFSATLNHALEIDVAADFDTIAASIKKGGEDPAILVDDAQHLILPMMGGLREFDSVLDLARRTSSQCTWIFAVDEALWRFLERARGSRPLFDEAIHLAAWTEDGIVRLLRHRNNLAGITPNFSLLLRDLPSDADEIDVQEALQRTEVSYYRLLWDYASGNPGVALHSWRKSLSRDADGSVLVRLFQAPEAESLEGLPDSTVFVLRATVQLGQATQQQLCRATALPVTQVQDALRYGAARGYFQHDGEHYQVTWNWFRAITRFLKRRHLLFTG